MSLFMDQMTFSIIISAYDFKLFWIIFIKERNRNTHNAIIVTRNICRFIHIYGIVVVVFRIILWIIGFE